MPEESETSPANSESARTVLLVNPPNPPGNVSNKDSMGGFGQLFPPSAPPFPPLDLPYLAAVLSEADVAVEVFEAGALKWSVEDLCRAIGARPSAGDAIVVVRTSLPTIDWDLEVCATLRARGIGSLVVLYGPVVSSLMARIEKDDVIDCAVMGEPDQAVLDLQRGVAFNEIAGLGYRDAEGRWQRTTPSAFRVDLDSIPFPRWDLMPVDRYTIPKSSAVGSMRFLPMLTSRGCPFGCNYCPYPVGQGLKWRYRSPANVVDEIEHIVRDFGVEYVVFRDPLFSANQKRVVQICQEIIDREIEVKWRCETRVDLLDEPTIAIMARAGCSGVNFGVESIDPQIQKNAHRKPITKDEFIETVGNFRKHGISTFAFFVVGLPGDTVDTILESIRFSLQLPVTWSQFTVATPFIGTKLHDWAVGENLIHADHYHLVSAHEGSTGNENLSPNQIHLMHRFAQILSRNFINRRGVLKNENRTDLMYRAARRVAEAISIGCGRVYFLAGSGFLRASMGSAKRGPATISVAGKRPGEA